MPRIRHLIFSLLTVLLSLLFAAGAFAESAIKKVEPAVKTNKNSYTIRPGIDTDMKLTLSMPGFLSVRTLDAEGNEIETLLTDAEYASGDSTFYWNCMMQDGTTFYAQGKYQLGFTLRDEFGNVSKEKLVNIETGVPRPVVSNVTFSNADPKKLWTFTADLSMDGSVRLDIFNANDLENRLYEIEGINKAKAGNVTLAWDGKIVEKEGNKVVDSYTLLPGDYAARVVLIDKDEEESEDEPVFITVVDDANSTPYITGTEPEIVSTPEPQPEDEDEDEEDPDDEKTGDDEASGDEEKPASPKSASAQSNDGGREDDRTIGKAIKNDVNVRAKPTTKGVRITRLKRGETATVLNTVTGDDGDEWYYIHTRGGDEGYVLASLIEIQ